MWKFFPRQVIVSRQLRVLQLSSVLALYLETVLGPQAKGSLLQDCAHPALDACDKQWVPRVTHNFCPIWLQIRGSHNSLLRID